MTERQRGAVPRSQYVHQYSKENMLFYIFYILFSKLLRIIFYVQKRTQTLLMYSLAATNLRPN